MAVQLLVLFDVDGTLLLDDCYAHGRAMVRAMRKVWKVALPDDVIERIYPWGKTDLRIAREALATVGVGDTAFEEGRDRWIHRASLAFEEEVKTSAREWRVREDLAAGIERLALSTMRLSLVTGNLRAIAQAKVREMGLLSFLDLAIGAYGDDAEERTALVPIARRRAGSPDAPWPRERVVVVGDTPGDIAAAEADRVRALIFVSARFPTDTLTGATRVVAGVADLIKALESAAADPKPQH